MTETDISSANPVMRTRGKDHVAGKTAGDVTMSTAMLSATRAEEAFTDSCAR